MSKNPAYPAVYNMEKDVKDVRRWAAVLAHMATSGSDIDGEDLNVVSGVLFDLGKRLLTQWEKAFNAAGGQA